MDVVVDKVGHFRWGIEVLMNESRSPNYNMHIKCHVIHEYIRDQSKSFRTWCYLCLCMDFGKIVQWFHSKRLFISSSKHGQQQRLPNVLSLFHVMWTNMWWRLLPIKAWIEMFLSYKNLEHTETVRSRTKISKTMLKLNRMHICNKWCMASGDGSAVLPFV